MVGVDAATVGIIITAIAAAIASIVPVLVILINRIFDRFDGRNTEQHEANLAELQSIRSTVEAVDEKLDAHILWHAQHNFEPSFSRVRHEEEFQHESR
jgi:hypothetical protein